MNRVHPYAGLTALALIAGCAVTQPKEPSAAGQAAPQAAPISASARELKYPEEPAEVATTKGAEQVAALKLAAAQYRTFIQRAAGDPKLSEAVERARQRVEDINATIAFLENAPSPPPGEAVTRERRRSFDEPNSTPPVE